MKKLLLSLMGLTLSLGAFSQSDDVQTVYGDEPVQDQKEVVSRKPVTMFVRAGWAGSSFSDFEDDWYEDNQIDGVMAGAGLKIPLTKRGRVVLQPELRFVMKGEEMHGGVYGHSNHRDKVKFHLNYLELPVSVMFPFDFGKIGFDFGGGLYAAYGIGGKVKANNGIVSIDNIDVTGEPSCFSDEVGFKRFDWGLTIETNFRFHDFFIGFGCEVGLMRPIEKGHLHHSNDYRNITSTVHLGYNFKL